MNQRGDGIRDLLKSAFKFAKEHRLVSRGLRLLAPRAGKYQGLVNTGAKVADALGLGKPAVNPKEVLQFKRDLVTVHQGLGLARGGCQYGSGKFWDALKRVGRFVKQHKLISKGLSGLASVVPDPRFKAAAAAGASAASAFGFGGGKPNRPQLKKFQSDLAKLSQAGFGMGSFRMKQRASRNSRPGSRGRGAVVGGRQSSAVERGVLARRSRKPARGGVARKKMLIKI